MAQMDYALQSISQICVFVLFVFLANRLVYNVFFHPLHKVPGPLFAKFSRIWLFMQDQSGNPHNTILKLHQDLGPVVRISPNEVSVNDVNCNPIIYSQNSPWPKAPYHYAAFKSAKACSIFTELNPEVHSIHLKLLAPSFSYAYVHERELRIYANTSKMIAGIARKVQRREKVELTSVFRSLALDIVTEYTYGKATGALNTFETELFEIFDKAVESVIYFQHFPPLRRLAPYIAPLFPYLVPNKIIGQTAVSGLRLAKQNDPDDAAVHRPNIFQNVLAVSKKKGIPISDPQLVSDGIVILAAGADTTAAAVGLGMYHLLQNPELYKRLQQELIHVMPESDSQPSLTTLESLPFLNAVIKEGLRISCPIRGHMPRVVPSEGWNYAGIYFPPNSVVATSAFYGCYDDKVFPNPKVYDPTRWLAEDTTLLNNYLQPFSRGTRQCIGQNLTLAIQRVAISQFVRNFNPGSFTPLSEIKTREYVTLIVDSPLHVELELAESL